MGGSLWISGNKSPLAFVIVHVDEPLHLDAFQEGQLMPENDRYVVKHPKGWAVKKPHAKRASAVHSTQADAERDAKEIVRNLGGGEVRVQNRQGIFRDSDTIGKRDPFPPRDTRH